MPFLEIMFILTGNDTFKHRFNILEPTHYIVTNSSKKEYTISQ